MIISNTRIVLASLVVGALTITAGCSSLPDRIEPLEQARGAVRQLNSDPMVGQAAPDQLRAAETALRRADKAYEDRADLDVIEHQAYLARRYAEVGQAQIADARLRQQIAESGEQRKTMQLAARTAEADQANAQATAATAQATAATAEATDAKERAAQLQKELEDLRAKPTERGMVLTLGDVLFDTGKATLKPGAADTINRLAAFLNGDAARRVLIEGHTDSRGSEDLNLDLSERRAGTVRDALIQRGIARERVAAVGAGEGFPIAGNDTAGGMQMNRRVEVVLSDEQGAFADAVARPGFTNPFSVMERSIAPAAGSQRSTDTPTQTVP